MLWRKSRAFNGDFMDVLILNPPWPGKGYGVRTNSRWPHRRADKHLPFPSYLAYSAALLEQNNISVKVIDAVAEELSIQKLIKQVETQKPKFIFIETSTPTINIDLHTARKINEKHRAKIFLMGAHVTFYHENILKENPYISGVIRGEFEFTILEIAQKKSLNKIKGLTFRKNKKIIANPPMPLIDNLDELPLPAWHQFNLKYYDSFLHESPSLIMITSRGCPYQCTFCLWPDLMYGHKQRYRSAKNVVDEMEILVNKY